MSCTMDQEKRSGSGSQPKRKTTSNGGLQADARYARAADAGGIVFHEKTTDFDGVAFARGQGVARPGESGVGVRHVVADAPVLAEKVQVYDQAEDAAVAGVGHHDFGFALVPFAFYRAAFQADRRFELR